MSTRILTSADELVELHADWERLDASDPAATFYDSYAWVTAWWGAYSDDDSVELRVVVITDDHDGRVVGIAPLARHGPAAPGGAAWTFRFAGRGDHRTFLVDPDVDATRVLRDLMEAVVASDWDVLSLGNIPAASPLLAHLLRSPHHQALEPHVESPYIELTPGGATARIPDKAPKYRNKLRREIAPTFEVVAGDAGGIFDRLAELHRLERTHLVERHGRSERHSLFDDARRRAHLRALYARPGVALTFTLSAPGGELIAYRTCFWHRRTLLSWNSAYHPDHERYRLGKVLQLDILDHLADHDIADRFDLGAGRYPWKFEWTDRFEPTYRLRLRRSPAVATHPGSRPAASAAQSRSGAPAAAPCTPAHRAAVTGARPPAGRQRRALGYVLVAVGDPRRAGRATRRRIGARLAPVRLAVGRVRRAVRRTRHRGAPPTVIWYAPHPDDETIYMGGAIVAQRDARNVVVALSRGGATVALGRINDRLGRSIDVDELVAARERELREAVTALGVASGDLHVLDLPDGQLSPAAIRPIITEMERRHPGASHRTTSPRDPHPDHRAAGTAVLAAWRAGDVVDCRFVVPWPPDTAAPDGTTSVVFDGPSRAAKRAALEAYRSWDPGRGRYAVGWHSVPDLIQAQHDDPVELTHGPEA